MTHPLSLRWMLVLLLFCALPALGACQPGDAGTAPASPASPAAPPAASVPAAPSATGVPVTPAPVGAQPALAATPTTAEVVYGSGAFNFPDAKAGLANLSGYKATLTLTFDGTRDGKSRRWTKTYVMLAAAKPPVRQLTIIRGGDLSDTSPVFMAEMDGAAYAQRGQNACTASVLEAENSPAARLEPAGFLNGVIGADAAGSETVNGVPSKHYTFDERAFGQSGIAKSTGELWIASEGGYIVKYALETKSTAAYFGDGSDGTLKWEYALSAVNQPVAIELPGDCPPGMVDAPLLPGATAVLRRPGSLSYSSSANLAQAAAFYQAQLPPLGWKPSGDPAMTDAYALQAYTQEARTMTVSITARSGGVTVRIGVQAAQR